MLSVRFAGQPFRRADLIDAGAGDEGSEHPLGAGRSERFDRVGGFASDMGAFEELLKEKPAQANDATRPRERRRRLSAGGRKMGGEDERLAQARLSNLPHYAATGVKAQAFVLALF